MPTKKQDVERALEHLRSAEVLIQRCKEGDDELESAHEALVEVMEDVEAVEARLAS